LTDAGRLSLDTRVADYLPPGIPRSSESVTIAHLLSHTSGISDYYDETVNADPGDFGGSVPWTELRPPRDCVAVFPQGALQYPPGVRFAYCDSGYILLGIVIEEITRVSYHTVVEESVMKPAGMTDSGFFFLDRLPERIALGYIEEAKGLRTHHFALPIVGAPAGGAYTTVGDLPTLWDTLWGGQLLAPDTVASSAAPRVPVAGAATTPHYGYGMWLRELPSGRLRPLITGSDAGVSMVSSSDPETRTTVSVLSNTTDGAPPVYRALMRWLSEASPPR